MNRMRKWATPLVVGTFALVAVSGVLMFFHAASPFAREAHEVLSLVLVAAALVHTLANVKGLGVALRPWLARGFVAVFVVLAVVAAIPAQSGGRDGRREGPPEFRVVEVVMDAPLDRIAVLLERSPADLAKAMEREGLKLPGEKASVREIARANEREPRAVLAAILE